MREGDGGRGGPGSVGERATGRRDEGVLAAGWTGGAGRRRPAPERARTRTGTSAARGGRGDGGPGGPSLMLPLVTQARGTYQVSGWPLAILVGGLLLPIAGKGRARLVVHLAKGRFGWNAPLVVDRASKQRIAAALDEIVAACRKAGFPVSD